MARDDTQDWLLPTGSVPTVVELEGRIDEALAIARAAEQTARTVGATAEQAVQQARRAADLAERASEVAVRSQPAEPRAASDLARFCQRADRLMARLRALERGVPRGHSAMPTAAERRAGG